MRLQRGRDTFHFVKRCCLSVRPRGVPVLRVARFDHLLLIDFLGAPLQNLDTFLQQMLQSAAFGPRELSPRAGRSISETST
jgi:hypothetical protein